MEAGVKKAKSRNHWMAVVFFMMMVPPGMWGPALTNIMEAQGCKWIVPYANTISPVMMIISALFFSSLADRKLEAQKLLGWIALSGAVFLYLSFACLQWGWNPWFYVLFQGCNAFISGPMFALITKIMLVNVDNVARKFPLYNMAGSLGWMFGGNLTSYLELDSSPSVGWIGALIRLCMGFLCFMLPKTLPAPSTRKGWKVALGIEAFSLFKNKQVATFFLVSLFVAIPYYAFYMYGTNMLKQLGSTSPTASFTVGQATELVAILLLSFWAGRLRVRWVITISMVLGVLRYVLFAYAAQYQLIWVMLLGVAMHGPIYAFMSLTGRMFIDRRVDQDMRGQAQALYGILTGSIGGILGAQFCGALYEGVVGESMAGWSTYWWIMAGFVSVCAIAFITFYKDMPEPDKAEAVS